MNYNLLLMDYDQVYREVQNVFICAYTINTSGLVPFLEYLFVNNSAGQLTLPQIEYNGVGIDCEQLSMTATDMLQKDFKLGGVTFKGYDVQDSNVYLFFYCKVQVMLANARFCLVDEIVNTRSCFGHQIVCAFFRNDMMYLYDDNGHKYENPVAGYRFSDNLSFETKLGVPRSDSLSLLGPYYYFTDYMNAVSNGSSVIRFALFLGSTLVKLNYPEDMIDESEIKLQRLEDDKLERKYECLTMRLSDHDGLWAETYDSVFVGRVELDDGSIIRNAPFIVVKKYDQFATIDHE